jgi:hypothetical protein
LTPAAGRRAALTLVLAGALLAGTASARQRRPRFEPTDLGLEDPGTMVLDLQTGPAFGSSGTGNRLVVPDLELGLGLTPNVELDIESAFAVDDFDGPHSRLDGEAPCTAMKLGLFDSRDADGRHVVAGGLELGPRLPTIGTRGLGYAALLLFGVGVQRTHLVANLGAIVDPGDHVTSGQAESLVGGVDLDLDLDARGTWSLLGELGMAYYVSPDPNEVTLAAGAAYDVGPALELSTMVLVGLLPGADRAAILFGVAPRLALF